MTTAFRPRQLIPISSETVKKFIGTATEDVARDLVRIVLPLPIGSRVHDNGCGAGAVTEAICCSSSSSSSEVLAMMTTETPQKSPPADDGSSSSPAPPPLLITATDKNAAVLDGLRARARASRWPVEARAIDSASLDALPDASFTHSFTNFVLQQAWRSDVQCAAAIRRTLRPGSLAVVTVWEDLPTMDVFLRTHRWLRGPDAPLPEMLRAHGYGSRDVCEAMRKAGFEERLMRVDRYETQTRVEDARRWCEIGWSMGGAPPAGWEQEDEDRWDEVIDYAREALVTGDWYQPDEDENKGWLRFTASAVVARN